MVRVRTEFSAFCCKLTRNQIRVPSPPLKSNRAYDSPASLCENHCNEGLSGCMPRTGDGNTTEGDVKHGNRIMVLIDSSGEAKCALQWALSHAVQKEDTVILSRVAKQSERGLESGIDVNPRAYGLINSMKSMCQNKRPGVQVEGVVLRGKKMGPLIVEEAKQWRVSLLVLGHQRRSMAWKVFMRWVGKRSSCRVVDYCIQNADCMTIAVRRKSRKLGGYLITTKCHKNFWHLA
ncbi:hypothetical protein Nepgr_023743 [Nepenthes gracilis]|uniref:UspA domain-containing protein n=1 Tax=Nepenthes gracilis TaxID=150966 RepID=A0AAD3XZE1_NEPGR|nr:hypothetical protein Nepgr_023743 [Nepenthes gracilis]